MKLTTDLTNYTPKGDLSGFPLEVIAKMLERQVEQGNKEDVTVFERCNHALKSEGGFDWCQTIEFDTFWDKVTDRDFTEFYQHYPKTAVPSLEDKVRELRGRMVERRDMLQNNVDDFERGKRDGAWTAASIKKDQFDLFINELDKLINQ